jgi:hypothetical protein
LAYDGGSQVDALNLYADAAGFSVAHGGWAPKVMSSHDTECAEVMMLIVEGSSHDDLATKLQNLAAKALEIQQHADDIATQQNVWLKVQLTNETSARMAFISEARVDIKDSLMGPPVSPGNFLSKCQLALVRGHWERDAVVVATSDDVDSIGGSDNYATVVGDLPARLRVLRFRGDVSGGGPLYEFWMGFRTSRLGTVANFVPIWECEDGTMGTDASIDNTSEVNTASPGGGAGEFVEVDFATETELDDRVTIEIEDVTANYGDQRGNFAILARMKVDAHTVCRVRLLDGFSSSDEWRTQSRIVISNTNWLVQTLGTVTIPPTRGFPVTGNLRKYALRLEAERVSGSGNLKIDCVSPVPMSEGFIHITGSAVQYVGGDTRNAEVRLFPDYAISGNAWAGGYPVSTLNIETQRYGLPVGSGTLFLIAQRETQSILADFCNIEMRYVPRWLTLRGAE